jgi:hypothetical protein
MFVWNMEDIGSAVDRARQGTLASKFPAHFTLFQCIEAMPFSYWQGKVRRIYIEAEPMYTNLLKWYAEWVEGPKGIDITTHSRFIRNIKTFNISFLGVVYLAKMGHLTGTCGAFMCACSSCCVLHCLMVHTLCMCKHTTIPFSSS